MSVKFFEWGKLTGGSTSGGGSVTPADALYGEPEQFDGTLAAGNTTVTFSNPTKWVKVINTHVSQALEVSFDAGATWLVIAAYGSDTYYINVSSILLRNQGAVGTTYQIIAGLTE